MKSFPPRLILLSILLTTVFLTAAGSLALAGQTPSPPTRLQCFSAQAKASRLPQSLPVGVETIHRDPEKIITIFVPLPQPGAASRIMDTNSKSETQPDRFVISDGTVKTAFIGVDLQPNGQLELCLAEIIKRLPTKKPAGIFDYIRDHLQEDYMREPPLGFAYAWDQGRKADAPELTALFHAAKDMQVGQYPLRSKQLDDVVPLEKFLAAGYGTCLHNALLASLLLRKLGIHNRLVNGATRSGGHTWIELDDGRILDPSLKQLEPSLASKEMPGWFKYGATFAFENQVWPYLALD